MFIKVTAFLLLLIIVSIPLFVHLDSLPFRLWDESRLASNAYEMHKSGNFIVTHYGGQPEMWNTKPPLVIWMQVFFIRLIGFGELAVRLPSAITGLLTCLVLLFFSRQYFGNVLIGAFASLVLITTNGYVDTHGIRTGDYDGPLALFTTVFVLSAFLYADSSNKKWIILFFTGITMAILTKSIQPLLFLPGITVFFLYTKKLHILLSKTILKDLLVSAVIIASYYITREIMNDGYLEAVWNNELGGRYFNALEENDEGLFYYISRMPGYLFPYWIFFLPVAILSGLLSKNHKIRQLTIFNFTVVSTYFIFITISMTKLYWYTVPLFPLLSIHISILLYQLYSYLKRINLFSRHPSFAIAIVCIVFIYPYQKIGRKVYHPQEYEWDKMYPISEMLQDAFHGKFSMHNNVIAYEDYDQHLKVYTDALKDMGQLIYFKQPGNLSQGDTVIASELDIFKSIESGYDADLLKDERGVKVYLIRSMKK